MLAWPAGGSGGFIGQITLSARRRTGLVPRPIHTRMEQTLCAEGLRCWISPSRVYADYRRGGGAFCAMRAFVVSVRGARIVEFRGLQWTFATASALAEQAGLLILGRRPERQNRKRITASPDPSPFGVLPAVTARQSASPVRLMPSRSKGRGADAFGCQRGGWPFAVIRPPSPCSGRESVLNIIAKQREQGWGSRTRFSGRMIIGEQCGQHKFLAIDYGRCRTFSCGASAERPSRSTFEGVLCSVRLSLV